MFHHIPISPAAVRHHFCLQPVELQLQLALRSGCLPRRLSACSLWNPQGTRNLGLILDLQTPPHYQSSGSRSDKYIWNYVLMLTTSNMYCNMRIYMYEHIYIYIYICACKYIEYAPPPHESKWNILAEKYLAMGDVVKVQCHPAS